MFGLGQKTGIDLPQEVSGVMPSEEWKIRNFKQKWFAGETISVGIGQGAVAVTPIQLARAIGAIASGGSLVRPHVAFPEDLPPNMVQASNLPDKVQIPLDPKNWEIITDAMANVTTPLGTANCGSSARYRLRGQDRNRPDHQQYRQGKSRQRESPVQGQRLVRGSESAQKPGNRGCSSVRGGRA